jgi:hypothetical protein
MAKYGDGYLYGGGLKYGEDEVARTDLTTQVTTRAGIVPTYEAVAAADDAMFVNTGVELVHIKNASGSTANLVFETPVTMLSEALAVADATATLATATEKVFGPFPTGVFDQPSGADVGKVYINTDQAITIAVIKAGSLS